MTELEHWLFFIISYLCVFITIKVSINNRHKQFKKWNKDIQTKHKG